MAIWNGRPKTPKVLEAALRWRRPKPAISQKARTQTAPPSHFRGAEAMRGADIEPRNRDQDGHEHPLWYHLLHRSET